MGRSSQIIYVVRECVAVCCSVLQYVAVCCSVLQCVAVCCSVLQCVVVCCSVLQCVAVCCSVLQCVAVCYHVLQFTFKECAARVEDPHRVVALPVSVYSACYTDTLCCILLQSVLQSVVIQCSSECPSILLAA